MTACQAAFRGVRIYKAQMIPSSSPPAFQCSHAYNYLFSSVLSFCVRDGRMRVLQVWYTDPVVPLSLNVLTETLNAECHVSRMTSLTLDAL
jgi:hypothetical protein